MHLSSEHTHILTTVARYYTLQRLDIQNLCMPQADDRTVRRQLLKLVQGRLLNKTSGEVVFQDRNGAPAPVYYPSKFGCEYLYALTKDERHLSVCTLTPNWQYLYHWLGVARFHVLFDQAVAMQRDVAIENWLGEWDIADHHAAAPEKKFKLFTLIRENPRLVANPDASFVTSYKGYRRGYYLEFDRATSGVRQIASSKPQGFAAMADHGLHARHFPGAENVPFRVLMVTPTAKRRDDLRAAIASKPGAALWRFVAQDDLRPDTAFHEPIVYPCEGVGQPLIKKLEGGQQ
jgi:hypothetical protein